MTGSSLKQDFIDAIMELPGVDGSRLASSLLLPPFCAIRINRRKVADPTILGYDFSGNVNWLDNDGYYLKERPIFTLNPMLHAGSFYVQDPSSMIYQQVIDKLLNKLANENPVVLDFCSAPGGKTTAMINALPDSATIVANEFVASRGKILRENLEKWGFPAVITTGNSSADYSSIPPIFDIIAVDAPCSGEGMMRKDNDARYQWSQALISQCSSLQREILSDVVKTLRPGGFMIYSTCTFNLEENEKNSLYIQEELGLFPVRIDDLNISGIEEVGRGLLPGVEALRFMPHLSDGEGLYLSIFQKRINEEDDHELRSTTPRSVRKHGKRQSEREGKDNYLSEEMLTELNQFLRHDYKMEFFRKGDHIHALPGHSVQIRKILKDAGLRLTGSGLPVAELKGKKILPDSRIVLSEAYKSGAFPEVGLDKNDALRFLRKESFPLPGNIPSGRVVISYNGLPLGLMNNLGNRANNLFPSSWRIRMNDNQ